MICKAYVNCSRKQIDWNTDCYGANTDEVAATIFVALNKLVGKGIVRDDAKITIEITPSHENCKLEITLRSEDK